MKNKYSILSIGIVVFIYIITRLIYTEKNVEMPLKVTTWDALGYYLYLPSTHLYNNDTTYTWFDSIDKKYNLSGGQFYQATQTTNGNLANKYLRGISIMQMPFYTIAHLYCIVTNKYPADGFSYPYQMAIAWGMLFYFILSLWILHLCLRYYYSDKVVAMCLFLISCATNAIQYIAIEGGQSHGYIFLLYCLMLYTTYHWHSSFRLGYAFCIGIIWGLACICRPTEAVMIFIPLLWNIDNKEAWKYKWNHIRKVPLNLILVILATVIAILPQLFYWKRVTGSWVYDVGSKWDFLNPHFRVLFGWEKGWFIYTPITLLFISGLFFIKHKPFRTAVISFCLVNIYIIIAWHIWRYGGSYSTRALVQSYPVFALAFCGILERMILSRYKFVLYALGIYLTIVNLFQVYQYNQNILHYDDMNFAYYKSIYLNPKVGAKEFSLLDNNDYVSNESCKSIIYSKNFAHNFHNSSLLLSDSLYRKDSCETLKIRMNLATQDIWARYIKFEIVHNSKVVKTTRIRMFHSFAKENANNEYVFFVRLPSKDSCESFRLSIDSSKSNLPEKAIISIQGYR